MKLLCERSGFRSFWKAGQKVYIIYITTNKEEETELYIGRYKWQWGVNWSLLSTDACSSLEGLSETPTQIKLGFLTVLQRRMPEKTIMKQTWCSLQRGF